MNKEEINRKIMPYKTNGFKALGGKDLLYFILSEVTALKVSITEQVTFCKTHLAEKKAINSSKSKMFTWILSIMAIVVSLFAILR